MKTKKVILLILAITTTLVMLNASESSATLQANPNTQYTTKDTMVNWLINFRLMEEAGGAMGLNETLESDLTASSKSNNIDVHMIRSPEYGAIAILSASGYGNPSNSQVITSTTGNNTGIILDTSWGNGEITSASRSEYDFSGTNSRYFDIYDYSEKVGDALLSCAGWHSAERSQWPGTVQGSRNYFFRGSGGIFSFYGYGINDTGCSRAIVVCGEGF